MTSGRELRWENTLEPGFGPPMRPSQPVLARPANLFNWGLSAVVNSCSTPTRVLNYLTFSRHGHRTTHGIPWHPHGISCHGIRFHGAVGGAVACHGWYHGSPRRNRDGTPWAALHGNLAACHDNPHGTPMSTAPRVGVRVPWYAVEVRGMFRSRPWKMPWNLLPHVVPRHATACREKGQ